VRAASALPLEGCAINLPRMAPRILLVDSGHEWRGAQRQVLLLARGLRDRQYEPLVVAPPGSPLVQRLRRAGIATSTVAMRGDWDLVAARRIRALVRTWNAGIVHAHDARSHAIALIALLDRPRVPLIVTRRVAQPPRGIRRQYAARVTRFLAASDAVRDALTRGGVDPERVEIVYPGVPAAVVEKPRDWRTECRWPGQSVVCGVVGAGAEVDGSLLWSIVERMSPDARRRACLLTFGGPGAGAYEIAGVPAFRAGFVDELHPALAGVDILVHLATSEGVGTALIDAMALGVPPITFGISGFTALVDASRSGVVVPPGDVDAFADALSHLILADTERRTLAAHGPARSAQFSVERMVDRVEAEYRRALGAADAARR
jgi:glycosyltransferase involved in cell wall biosynthesis